MKRSKDRRQVAEMPSKVTPHRGFFDRIADSTNKMVSTAPYFAACVIGVLIWAGSGPMFKFSDTWQLVINTSTTILTFLMVALLQNSSKRSDQAIQHKLNAIADGLADLMSKSKSGLGADVRELRAAVGLEDRESTQKNIAGKK